MLRHAVQAEPNRPITLFYSVRTEEDIAFRQELALLAARHPRFRLFVAVTDAPAPAGFFPGRLNGDLFRATTPDIVDADCLVCGPPGMMEAVTSELVALGVPRSQIRSEVFQAVVAASGGPESLSPDRAPDPPAANHEARFARSKTSTRVAAGQTLLEASETCGATIPSLCRSGVCGTCRTRVLEGDVNCASNILDDQDRADGYVLPCVSRLHSDCTVDA
jgi:NADH oxidoreductase Hcr